MEGCDRSKVKGMIYDCFQFFNELDILYLRMKIMDPIVDRFVISEATTTFSDIPKPLYFQENQEMFREFQDKIIHVVVNDTPPGDTHVRDTFQKNAVGRGLAEAKDEDIIIFSDLDEIPNPEKIKEILPNFQDDKIYHFAQRLFYCYLNMEEVSGSLLSYAGEFEGVERKQWIGSKMCRYKLLKEQNLQLGDLRFPERKECGIRVADGGWHFGYMGGKGEADLKKRVQQKVISAAHQEYNSREILNDVSDKLKDGQDIFGREAQFVLITIDETYPEYIRTHQKELAHLIMQQESEEDRIKRQRKRKIRKVCEKGIRGVKKLGRIVTGRK
ncbi:MAG: glycosyl transferase GT17 family protein [Lachnospiraceae bacterium]|nr:glycosyl transferase GT17 family protein [Lachnospiraceae bacterium]MDD7049983.1 glycosyl transferase GT17 family protein [Lachnospiraceae bacterium]MDY4097835.1 glycosyl transferase GT17 family protein [Lachnospiraceae bacterium]